MVRDHQPKPDRTGRPAGDLEYDLAHEASTDEVTAGPADTAQQITIVTGTPAYDGDYSYDLAHDIPGR